MADSQQLGAQLIAYKKETPMQRIQFTFATDERIHEMIWQLCSEKVQLSLLPVARGIRLDGLGPLAEFVQRWTLAQIAGLARLVECSNYTDRAVTIERHALVEALAERFPRDSAASYSMFEFTSKATNIGKFITRKTPSATTKKQVALSPADKWALQLDDIKRLEEAKLLREQAEDLRRRLPAAAADSSETLAALVKDSAANPRLRQFLDLYYEWLFTGKVLFKASGDAKTTTTDYCGTNSPPVWLVRAMANQLESTQRLLRVMVLDQQVPPSITPRSKAREPPEGASLANFSALSRQFAVQALEHHVYVADRAWINNIESTLSEWIIFQLLPKVQRWLARDYYLRVEPGEATENLRRDRRDQDDVVLKRVGIVRPWEQQLPPAMALERIHAMVFLRELYAHLGKLLVPFSATANNAVKGIRELARSRFQTWYDWRATAAPESKEQQTVDYLIDRDFSDNPYDAMSPAREHFVRALDDAVLRTHVEKTKDVSSLVATRSQDLATRALELREHYNKLLDDNSGADNNVSLLPARKFADKNGLALRLRSAVLRVRNYVLSRISRDNSALRASLIEAFDALWSVHLDVYHRAVPGTAFPNEDANVWRDALTAQEIQLRGMEQYDYESAVSTNRRRAWFCVEHAAAGVDAMKIDTEYYKRSNALLLREYARRRDGEDWPEGNNETDLPYALARYQDDTRLLVSNFLRDTANQTNSEFDSANQLLNDALADLASVSDPMETVNESTALMSASFDQFMTQQLPSMRTLEPPKVEEDPDS